jgi:putative Mn2+ efflux pump MntP
VTVKREALVLVGLVLAVDALFIGVYFGAEIERASDSVKIAFTVIWTVVNLAVVVRGLTRIRGARVNRPPG